MVAASTNGMGGGSYGTGRGWVIGIAVAYPSGKVARAVGKVVKNVAGYDLMKLHIGALGTLGVVAEVNFKVQTQPEAQATLLTHFDAPAPALEAGIKLGREYLAPAAAIVLDRDSLSGFLPPPLAGEGRGGGGGPWALALKFDGYAREGEAAAAQAVGIVREAGGRPRAGGPPTPFWGAAPRWAPPQ